jgi:hypothetical protein
MMDANLLEPPHRRVLAAGLRAVKASAEQPQIDQGRPERLQSRIEGPSSGGRRAPAASRTRTEVMAETPERFRGATGMTAQEGPYRL